MAMLNSLISLPRVSFTTLVFAFLAMSSLAVGLGFILGESKEDLNLDYDVEVKEHDEHMSIKFTLTDEGRLKPLDAVQFMVPSLKRDERGGGGMDLVVTIQLHEDKTTGKRTGNIQILKELGNRSEIWLNTHTKDGKPDPLTQMHHVIRVADYIRSDF